MELLFVIMLCLPSLVYFMLSAYLFFKGSSDNDKK